MATTQKITITLPVEQVEAIRELVGEGRSANISRFVSRAVARALEDDRAFETWVDEVLERTGGPMTAEEIAWADGILGK